MSTRIKIIGAFLLALLFLAASAADAEEAFRWDNVAADPCNPQSGCTIEWALDRAVKEAGWPLHTAVELHIQVRTVPARHTIVQTGWRGWMTWGRHRPRFEADTLAVWEGEQTALLWTTRLDGVQYNLIQVNACGNWGGWREEAPPEELTLIIPPPDYPPLGVIPTVYCN